MKLINLCNISAVSLPNHRVRDESANRTASGGFVWEGQLFLLKLLWKCIFNWIFLTERGMNLEITFKEVCERSLQNIILVKILHWCMNKRIKYRTKSTKINTFRLMEACCPSNLFLPDISGTINPQHDITRHDYLLSNNVSLMVPRYPGTHHYDSSCYHRQLMKKPLAKSYYYAKAQA